MITVHIPRQHKVIRSAHIAMATALYYDRLEEFQREIATEITQKEVNIDKLIERARKRGLVPSGYYTNPDSGKLVASREKKIVTLVSRCVEKVKRNGDLLQTFLALLEEVGLQPLVNRIRRRLGLEQGEDLKPKRGRVPPPSDDSGISASVSSTGQFLPPLPEIPTTLPSYQPPTHNEGALRQPDQRMSRSRPRQRSKSLPEYGDESELSVQPLTSPIHSVGSSMLPVEETQEDNTEDFVVPDMQPRLLHEEDPVLEERQVQTERAVLQKQTQQLIKDKRKLEKELKNKQQEIKELQAKHQRVEKEKDEHIKHLKEQRGEDEKELERLRARTAELEKELEQKDKDSEDLKRDFSEKEREIKSEHEQVVEKLRKQLLEEKAKADQKEIHIKELNNQLLLKELEKQKILDEYKDRVRTLERKRDSLKVELTELRLSLSNEKCKSLQQEKEEEQRKCRAVELKREEETRKYKAERRKSQAKIDELQKKLNSNT